MTDTAYTVSRTIDARGSFCPGPLMELIRGIRESAVGDVLEVYSSDSGSPHQAQVSRPGSATLGAASQ